MTEKPRKIFHGAIGTPRSKFLASFSDLNISIANKFEKGVEGKHRGPWLFEITKDGELLASDDNFYVTGLRTYDEVAVIIYNAWKAVQSQ